jgi:uncharacterized repeat protein (TIGR03803 family)
MNAFPLERFKQPSISLASMTVVFLLSALAVIAIAATPAAQAQPAFTVLHSFTGAGDGGNPITGLTIDAAGNLYGTTFNGGVGFGTVFRLRHNGSGWVLTPLYRFAGGNDGAYPYARVSIAQDGTLYGTTEAGGNANGSGWGTIFHLKPAPVAPRNALAPWIETVLYSFTGGNDGAKPQGDLLIEPSGNIYGTAISGGTGDGVVYELAPSGGNWTESVLYAAQDSTGTLPWGGVVSDAAGNLYGVFENSGPNGVGAVYQLSPSGSGWTEQTIHAFTYVGSDGGFPYGGLILDSSGNLYGTTSSGGASGGGTAFELTPDNGGWAFNALYGFVGSNSTGPKDKLIMDAAGNLYGTTYSEGAFGNGSVFELSPSNNGWIYTSLHDFTGGSDGALPISSLIFDRSGNLYGTAESGGASGNGVVFQITP